MDQRSMDNCNRWHQHNDSLRPGWVRTMVAAMLVISVQKRPPASRLQLRHFTPGPFPGKLLRESLKQMSMNRSYLSRLAQLSHTR